MLRFKAMKRIIRSVSELDKAAGENSCQYIAHTKEGDYLIQIAWPLCWSKSGVPPKDDPAPQTLFLVDGNAYFFTAVDVTRRMEFLDDARTVVVGIGYPHPRAVYDFRRGPDLTPASPDGKYDMPLDGDGKPRTDLSFGKAAEHLELIKDEVMDYLYGTLLPHPLLKNGRKALYGHSYGGIFSLWAMLTHTTLFDSFIAASPTIWWNDSFLMRVCEVTFRTRKESSDYKPPSLLLTWGQMRKALKQQAGESDENFTRRLNITEEPEMRDSALEMANRMRASGKLRVVATHEFPDEDHGGAAVTGLQLGIMKFLSREI